MKFEPCIVSVKSNNAKFKIYIFTTRTIINKNDFNTE